MESIKFSNVSLDDVPDDEGEEEEVGLVAIYSAYTHIQWPKWHSCSKL